MNKSDTGFAANEETVVFPQKINQNEKKSC